MSHRRDSSYHEQLREFLGAEKWSQAEMDALDREAKTGIGVSDEALERITRFIVGTQTRVLFEVEFDRTFAPQEPLPTIERTDIAQLDQSAMFVPEHVQRRFEETL